VLEEQSFVPDDGYIVLGLLSTKVRKAEDAGSIGNRIREASNIVPLERLGVSLQCGFWDEMSVGAPAETEAKLRRVVEVPTGFGG
jgi:5-methyltetrahydropteroyltriglutamate--homocysteine methyltransferase